MRYKGDYSPTYVLDPEDYTWFPLEEFRPLLDQYHYASCARPDRCLSAPATKPCAWLTCFHTICWLYEANATSTDPPREPPGDVLGTVKVVVRLVRNTITVADLTVSHFTPDAS